MKILIATKNDEGMRLDKFLKKVLKNAPDSLIYKWIRKKRIKINSKSAKLNQRLFEGDEISLYINDEFFKDAPEAPPYFDVSRLSIAYEDENIIVADKQGGLLCQPKPSNPQGENLEGYIKSYLYQKGECLGEAENTFSPQLCHRIDKNTAGLVIAAKNKEALLIINEKLKNREIQKYYLLRAEGEFEKKQGDICGYIKRDERNNVSVFYEKFVPGAKKAVTLYKVLGGSLVLAELKTGRTHQIRASFAHIGHPLIGDVKYGAKPNDKNEYQQLLAAKIVFGFKTDAGILNYLKGKEVLSKQKI